MRAKLSITMDEDLLQKVTAEAEKCGIPVYEMIEVACMAMVDQKALLKHTGGLFKQLGKIVGEGITRKQIMETIKE